MNKIPLNNYHFKKLLNLQIKKYENNTIRHMNNIIKNNNNKDFKNFIKDQHKVLTNINNEQTNKIIEYQHKVLTNKIIDFHNNRANFIATMIICGVWGCICANIVIDYSK